MCGIAAYAGKKDAPLTVYNLLLRLEYRGYDSAGIACLNGGKIALEKHRGRVEKLDSAAHTMQGTVAIGHTRWATHGAPSDINAHPHTYGRFSIAHNGIIENYSAIKADICGGERFLSDTDSEVIAHLLDKNYSGDMLFAMRKCVEVLKGSYAIMAICTDFEGFIAAKNKSPVIVGRGKSGNFCASDEGALSGICDSVCALNDGDIAIITAENISIYDKGGTLCRREFVKLRADQNFGCLSGYPYFMPKEIDEIPKTIKKTARAFRQNEHAIKNAVTGAERFIFVGCGTAYHAAMLGKRYTEEFARVPCEAEISSEFRYKNPVITKNTVVVAVTQSGETADTVEAARLSVERGARVIAVTNCLHSEITRVAQTIVPVAAGAEICVAATKSYAGQISALYLLAKTIAKDDGGEIDVMPEICSKTLTYARMNAVAHMCARSHAVYFLGRGCDYAVAVEGSLKLKEVSYTHSEGYPSGELKHGTLALVDENTTVIAIICDSALKEKSISAVHETLSRGAKVAIITNIEEVKKELSDRAEIVLLPGCDKFLSPLLSAIAVQKLAYETAILLGRDPDKPRNLAKSVTVE